MHTIYIFIWEYIQIKEDFLVCFAALTCLWCPRGHKKRNMKWMNHFSLLPPPSCSPLLSLPSYFSLCVICINRLPSRECLRIQLRKRRFTKKQSLHFLIFLLLFPPPPPYHLHFLLSLIHSLSHRFKTKKNGAQASFLRTVGWWDHLFFSGDLTFFKKKMRSTSFSFKECTQKKMIVI